MFLGLTRNRRIAAKDCYDYSFRQSGVSSIVFNGGYCRYACSSPFIMPVVQEVLSAEYIFSEENEKWVTRRCILQMRSADSLLNA